MKNIITAAMLITTIYSTSLHTVELRSGKKLSPWGIQKIAQQKTRIQKNRLNDKNKIKELTAHVSQLQEEIQGKNAHIADLQKCISSMITGI